MRLLDLTKKALVIGLAAQLALATQMSTGARAEMLGTDAAISKYSALANRDALLGEVRKEEVREKIIALGVDPTEAEARLEALSDAEIASMVSQMDEESAGAGAVVGALVTVFIILLVTDLLCLTKVFNFTRCAVR
ncbi:MAG: PA2779 family protein [Planctomycetota bacterium]|jgi:hypothetical protein